MTREQRKSYELMADNYEKAGYTAAPSAIRELLAEIDRLTAQNKAISIGRNPCESCKSGLCGGGTESECQYRWAMKMGKRIEAWEAENAMLKAGEEA